MSDRDRHTPSGAALTEIVLEVFRLHGGFIAAGDALTADLGLTSARWQVLGALAMAGTPLTLVAIARSMGLTRQAVRRTVNELEAEGFLRFQDNPEHRRAHLVALTDRGADAYAKASRRQVHWVNHLATAADDAALAMTAATLRAVRRQLDHQPAPNQGEGDE
ncbi:MAG TPA: MarR family transcriptional regulator [Geminicoccus sp.]|jgi:DNA-binding MarR family transcriptional regulator|uniref:MarR family winged helix-turn-helix transcriptional regulator n=1 Tax=Geminicoccus sp. TaxID=2024832 RepID=UPI002E340C12|nr:MarR family transcriptional regulator [Geminicoccus sp.]HEX2527384.1 MarR family transcriptional regulator [Geminicoccus sp.]